MTGTKTKFATDEEDDPQLKEFLEVMKPRQQSRLWTNDDIVGMTEVVRIQGGVRGLSVISMRKRSLGRKSFLRHNASLFWRWVRMCV